MILSKAIIEDIQQDINNCRYKNEKDYMILALCNTCFLHLERLDEYRKGKIKEEITPKEMNETIDRMINETESLKDTQYKTKHNSSPIKPEPMPQGNGEIVLPEVVKDLIGRSDEGKLKYGTRLRINNGRDALMDAYQEALDLVMYLKQAIVERSE